MKKPLFLSFTFVILFTYFKLYLVHLLEWLNNYLKSKLSHEAAPTEEENSNSYLDEYEMMKREYDLMGRGSLDFKKLSPIDSRNELDQLIRLHLTETCSTVFNHSIQHYLYKNTAFFLLLVSFVFNFVTTEYAHYKTLLVLAHLIFAHMPMIAYTFSLFQYYRMRFRLEMTKDQVVYFLALRDKSPIGYLVLSIKQHTELVSCFIINSYRGMSIGKHLVSTALFHCKLRHRCDIQTVWCSIEYDDYKAIKFLQTSNFKLVSSQEPQGYLTFVNSIRTSNRCSFLHSKFFQFYYLVFQFDLNSLI